MAFGIGKAFKKAWKGTVGKLEDGVKVVVDSFTGESRRDLTQAQIASAERIAAMQNQPQIQASITPTAEIENAQIAEENLASSKRRAFMFANTVRGNGGTLSARKTLG